MFRLEVASVVRIGKRGKGRGTIATETETCDEICEELVAPYVAGEQLELRVTPEDGSVFAGWEAADGTPLEDIYYANPGDTVYAIFELK
jgi:hypothetical protein